MAATLSPSLAPALQALIDMRLDTIDRMLLGRLPRQERESVVSDVAAQIFELLSQQASDEPTREDVLTVLAKLDPPEAYVPDEETPEQPRHRTARTERPVASAPAIDPRPAKASGILGLVAIGLVLMFPFFYLFSAAMEADALIILGTFAGAVAVFVSGLMAIVFGMYARVRGIWAVSGVATGSLAVLIGTMGFSAVMLFGI